MSSAQLECLALGSIGRWHGAKLANSMHNMLCIGIDFGRALHLDSVAVCNDPDALAPTRMRFIHNETKRTEYAEAIEAGLVVAAVADKVRVASEMLPNLEATRRSEHVCN